MNQKFGKLLTAEEAAAILGVKLSTVRRRILLREIDYIKLGRSVRIPQEVVDALIAKGYRPAIKTV